MRDVVLIVERNLVGALKKGSQCALSRYIQRSEKLLTMDKMLTQKLSKNSKCIFGSLLRNCRNLLYALC